MDDAQNEPPAWLLASIERGRADVAAGRFGNSDDVLSEIAAAIVRLDRLFGVEEPQRQAQQGEHSSG
jgi:hypothetical protein